MMADSTVGQKPLCEILPSEEMPAEEGCYPAHLSSVSQSSTNAGSVDTFVRGKRAPSVLAVGAVSFGRRGLREPVTENTKRAGVNTSAGAG